MYVEDLQTINVFCIFPQINL